jgi:hypothetical protein
MEKTGYFETEPGKKSSIRLQMFLTMFFAFIVIGYQTYATETHTPDFLTMITLLTAAFAPKLLQKLQEVKK